MNTESPRPEIERNDPPARSEPESKAAHGLPSENVLLGVGAVLLAGAVLGAFLWPGSGGRVLALLPAVAMILALGRGWMIRRRFLGSVARLDALLSDVRRGREPIESLSRVTGDLAPLAITCQELARDIRAERARVAAMEDESRQRIANRTSALERTIGALRQQAARDGLTGLFNRRTLDTYLPEAIERCRSGGLGLCVMMIDIDYFKPLNDTLGHAAGDQMLRSIGQIIRSTIRHTDLAFRCGGDEFVVVFEGCNLDTARELAQRVASLGDALGRTFRITPPPALSIGLASLGDTQEPTTTELLKRADLNLYQVKTAHHDAAVGDRPASRTA